MSNKISLTKAQEDALALLIRHKDGFLRKQYQKKQVRVLDKNFNPVRVLSEGVVDALCSKEYITRDGERFEICS